ncbi:type VII secretion target [Nocardia sp. NPDC056100]|uniref:type VII secretion target n=1 Tax=Nocardia sp. NPDC056100 TaxID=3345712 RepID=UPI0035DF0971
MVGFDPERMRQLATFVRERADAIAGKVPVANESRLAAIDEGKGMKGSRIAVTISETVLTLDTVMKYHVTKLRQVADTTDAAATAAEGMDGANAGNIQKAGPR